MIRDVAYWQAWEQEQGRREAADYAKNRAVFDRLMAEARALGQWPPRDRLEGLEDKIRWLRELDGRTEPGDAGPGA